ncbi:MAG: hypothetical protein U0L20_07925 [Ruminococcus sp.]|nr:hypothetical protein [Ruminococcus sp.]
MTFADELRQLTGQREFNNEMFFEKTLDKIFELVPSALMNKIRLDCKEQAINNNSYLEACYYTHVCDCLDVALNCVNPNEEDFKYIQSNCRTPEFWCCVKDNINDFSEFYDMCSDEKKSYIARSCIRTLKKTIEPLGFKAMVIEHRNYPVYSYEKNPLFFKSRIIGDKSLLYVYLAW